MEKESHIRESNISASTLTMRKVSHPFTDVSCPIMFHKHAIPTFASLPLASLRLSLLPLSPIPLVVHVASYKHLVSFVIPLKLLPGRREGQTCLSVIRSAAAPLTRAATRRQASWMVRSAASIQLETLSAGVRGEGGSRHRPDEKSSRSTSSSCSYCTTAFHFT